MQKCMGQQRRSTVPISRFLRQASSMTRRAFLGLIAGGPALGALAGCTRPAQVAQPAPRRKIRAICFDLFTLFDPRGVVTRAKRYLPEQAAELCDAWRARQFEYAFIRASAGQYLDFERVTADALEFALRAKKLELAPEARRELVRAYSELDPWPDTRAQLTAFRQAGLRLAPLANYSPSMLERLLAHSALESFFEAQLSTDLVRGYKPEPRAYALGPDRLRLAREEIAFSAFGGWDAAGAKWFGFPTFWVNRLGVAQEELAPGPDATGPTLSELADFIARWA